MHSQRTPLPEYDANGNWQPCGPGCTCNSLTLICRGPVESAPYAHGDLSDIGQIAVCAWCSWASASGDHVWIVEEDYPGTWACADEDACHARFLAL